MKRAKRKNDIDVDKFVRDHEYRIALFGIFPQRALCLLSTEFAFRVLPNFESVHPSVEAPRKAIAASIAWAINPTEANQFDLVSALRNARSAARHSEPVTSSVRSAFSIAKSLVRSLVKRESTAPVGSTAKSAEYAALAVVSATVSGAVVVDGPPSDNGDVAAMSAEFAAWSVLSGLSGVEECVEWSKQLKWSLAAYQGAYGEWEYPWWEDSWSNPTVIAMASSIFKERAFDRMPILADALEEAGCDDIGLLEHLRDPDAVFTRADRALLGSMCGSEIYRRE